MIFEGKTLAERTAVVDASEETLKAPSWSCNSWSSSVANLFPGLRAENQGGRSHCASTWSTLGTQVLIFSLLPLNLRAHHLLHLFRFGCRKEKGRGQGKPTSQKKQGEEGQKGTSWAVCFCCPTSKRRTRWRWRWSWRSRGSWWGVSWVYTMAMFFFAYGPTPGNVGWHLYVHGNESTDSYVCGCHVSIWTWIKKKTVLDLLDAPDQHRSVPPWDNVLLQALFSQSCGSKIAGVGNFTWKIKHLKCFFCRVRKSLIFKQDSTSTPQHKILVDYVPPNLTTFWANSLEHKCLLFWFSFQALMDKSPAPKWFDSLQSTVSELVGELFNLVSAGEAGGWTSCSWCVPLIVTWLGKL